VNYGAPQIRERVLFFGNRCGLQVDFPAPTHGPSSNRESTRLQPSLLVEPQLLPWRTLGDAIAKLHDPNPVVLDFSPRKKSYLEMVPPGSNWRSLSVELQQESMGKAWHAKGGRSGWWRRLTFDLPCPTLVTMPNHASTSLCHPTETRALSIREYSRIQEFPDSWHFSGTVSEQYTQVGNAVPVRLGTVAGNVIAAHLDHFRAKKRAPAVSHSVEPRIVYLQSHVRTRQWFKNGHAVVWDDGASNSGAQYGAPRTMKKTRGL
jgi:DNA (cytosine-5)-methyltransferase 1